MEPYEMQPGAGGCGCGGGCSGETKAAPVHPLLGRALEAFELLGRYGFNLQEGHLVGATDRRDEILRSTLTTITCRESLSPHAGGGSPQRYDEALYGRRPPLLLDLSSPGIALLSQSALASLNFHSCESAVQAMVCAWAPALVPFLDGQGALHALESQLGSGSSGPCDGGDSRAINYLSTFSDDWASQPAFLWWTDPRAWSLLFPLSLGSQELSNVLLPQAETFVEAFHFLRSRAAAFVPGTAQARDDSRNACVFLKRLWLMSAALLYIELRFYYRSNLARFMSIIGQSPTSCRDRLRQWMILQNWETLDSHPTVAPRMWLELNIPFVSWFPPLATITRMSSEEVERQFAFEAHARWSLPPSLPSLYRCPGISSGL